MRPKLLAVLLLLTWSRPLGAQENVPAPPPPPPSAEPLPTPTVSDPMLAPLPPPARVISSWDEAMALVRARSTDLRIAYDEVLKAEGQSRVALAGALPSLTAQGTAGHQILASTGQSAAGSGTGQGGGQGGSKAITPVTSTGSTAGGNWLEGRLTFVAPLVDVRAWHAIGTAHAVEDAAKLSIADLERTLTANVASTIVSAVTAERVAELDRVGLRNALERLQLTIAKEASGTATGLDVVRARQDVSAARSAVVSGDESLRQAREALGLALGVPEGIGVAPGIDLKSLEQGALAACKPVTDLEKRADIVAARKRLEVAKRGVTDVDEQFLPTLSAQSALSASAYDTGPSPRTSWNITAVLSVPLWDGGVRYGLRKSALATEDEAAAQLEALRRSSTIGVTQAARAVQVAEQARAVAAEQRALAAEVDRLSLIAYRNGKGTSLDLVVSATALRQAELNLAVAEFGLVRARIAELLTLATCTR